MPFFTIAGSNSVPAGSTGRRCGAARPRCRRRRRARRAGDGRRADGSGRRVMSSSRVQTSFTGCRPPIALAMLARLSATCPIRGWRGGRSCRRRTAVLIFTCSGLRPDDRARRSPGRRSGTASPPRSRSRSRVELHHAVQRLHRRVGEIRELVDRLERLRGAGERRRGVAVLARADRPGFAGEAPVLREELGAAARLGLALVPLDLERLAALARGPEALRQHRDAGRHLHHVDHARATLRAAASSKDLHGGAEQRRPRDHRGEHVGQLHVDA